MTIKDIRDKLNEDWGRYKYPLIIKIQDRTDKYGYVYILFTYQGFFWYSPAIKQVRYIHLNSELARDSKVLKVFYADKKRPIDKVLRGEFKESDEQDVYEISLKEFDSSIEDLIPSEQEERTQDLINKFGLV